MESENLVKYYLIKVEEMCGVQLSLKTFFTDPGTHYLRKLVIHTVSFHPHAFLYRKWRLKQLINFTGLLSHVLQVVMPICMESIWALQKTCKLESHICFILLELRGMNWDNSGIGLRNPFEDRIAKWVDWKYEKISENRAKIQMYLSKDHRGYIWSRLLNWYGCVDWDCDGSGKWIAPKYLLSRKKDKETTRHSRISKTLESIL